MAFIIIPGFLWLCFCGTTIYCLICDLPIPPWITTVSDVIRLAHPHFEKMPPGFLHGVCKLAECSLALAGSFFIMFGWIPALFIFALIPELFPRRKGV